jgi:gamma-glutamyltranspeptidase/glutathione hydrolase
MTHDANIARSRPATEENADLAGEVASDRGVVSAWPRQASAIGAELIAAGGNAMDAAAAAALACCVTRPEMTGIAGYLLAAVVLDGSTGAVSALDSSSTAPAGAHAAMYDVGPPRKSPIGINEDEYLCSVGEDANLYGGSSVATPGVLAGIGALWEQWGTLPWSSIVEPSIALVERGIPYAELTVRMLAEMAPVLATHPEAARVLMPEGSIPDVGDVWRRPDMAETLRQICDHGWRHGYDGELAERIVDAVQADGGVLTMSDMANFAPRISEPYRTTFRDAEVFGPTLPSGAITSLQILNLLDTLPVKSDDTVEYWHQLAEVLKFGWRDRLMSLGDPDFVDVDVERILSKADALDRTERLRNDPRGIDDSPLDPSESRHGTLHLSSSDSSGNVVALTLTHGAAFGSCLAVPGTGVILGHGMSRLDPRAGRPNSISGGKRPLNNVAPMITRTKERAVATGLPGGRRIVSVAAQLAQRLVDYEASALAAVTAPRMHVTHWGVELSDSVDPELVDGLRAAGHNVQVVADVGGSAHAAEFRSSDGSTLGAGSKSAPVGA